MKLTLKGTPREVAFSAWRLTIDVEMREVEIRMFNLAMRCQERARRGAR